MNDDYMTYEELATKFKKTKQYWYDISSRGELDGCKIKLGHRTVLFDKAAIEKWIDSKRVGAKCQ